MNWDQFEGEWKQSVGKVKEKWGRLTDGDLTTIAGKRDQLVGKIQEGYGIAKETAEKQVQEFAQSFQASAEKSPRQRLALWASLKLRSPPLRFV